MRGSEKSGPLFACLKNGIIILLRTPNLNEETQIKRITQFFTAVAMAFLPLFFATPVQADEPVDPVVVVVTQGGDDSSYQVPLTTTITFDGVTYNSVYATTNSVITFGQPDGTYWDFPRTPSISLYSMDWVVYPNQRADEHLIISASDGGFQVDISARPIWLQNATEPTNINIVAAINTDGTVAISYSLTGPAYEGQTRTGVTLTSGQVVTLEEYGVIQVVEPPVLEPEPVAPTPTPDPTIDPTPEPTPTIEPTPTPTPEPTQEPTPTPEPTPIVTGPTIPIGATLLSEGSVIEVVAPAGQRITSIMAWYGDPNDSTRGVDVSSTLTQLASGQTSVTIDSSNIYGDPAPGTVKTLIFIIVYEEAPVVVPPTPEPTPVPPVVEPTPEPTPTPQPTVDPTPPVVIPEPVVTPTPEPTPSPTPTIEPTPSPQPEPTPEPTVEPTPIPEPTPEVEPAPEPIIEPEPIKEPEPKPIAEPEPKPEKVPEVKSEEAKVDELILIDPKELTNAQVEQLVSAAEAVLETAEQGSPEYDKALEALAVAAEADDAELPSEIAAIPLLGDVAGAALEIFNNLGNVGADMAPAVREEAEKTVIATVIAAGAAINAVQSATAAAAAAAVSSGSSGTTGGSSGGSSSGSSARKKE